MPNDSDAPKSRKSRWYVPTLPKILLAVLVMQGVLVLSAHFRWFWFNEEKGYTVVITVATTVLLVSLVALFLLGHLFFKFKAHGGLVALILVVPVIVIPCVWLMWECDQARQQRSLVATALGRGFGVDFDKRLPDDLAPSLLPLSVREYLVSLLGEDFFAKPNGLVVIARSINEDDLELVARFDRLEYLLLMGKDGYTDYGEAFVKRETRLERRVSLNTFGGWSKCDDVTDATLSRLSGLTELRELRLVGTSVSDEGLDHLRGLTKLEDLGLYGSRMTDAGVAKLVHHAQLRRLSLPGIKVTYAGLARLKELAQLQELELADTDVSDAGLAQLKAFPQLTRVDLHSTTITDIGMPQLAEMKNLESLSLAYTRITGDGLEHLGGLTKMKSLDLMGTRINDAGLAHLRTLTNLQVLRLGGSRLSDAGLARLKTLTQLRQLILNGTKVTDEGVRDFMTAVPGCKVSF